MLDKQVGVYQVAEEIGRGSFAVVSKGYHMVSFPSSDGDSASLFSLFSREKG
jgi:hypothetical protein